MPSLLQRLRERKLFRWAIAYAAAAWVAYEVLLAIGGVFSWPTPILRVITVLLGVGFFVVLVIGWHHGEKGRQKITPAEIGALASLVLIAAGLSWWAARSGGSDVVAGTVFDPAPNSVAVLPCANIGADVDNAAFVDGVHTDILSHLSKIGSLTPISRTSVMEYRDTAHNLREIAEQLNVATVMECSVQRSGEVVRISAQLVDARTDASLWSEDYDRELTTESLFAIQAQVAENVAAALATELTGEEKRRIEKPLTDNLEAYEFYVRSREFIDENPEELVAIRLLEQAIELDPAFAAAYARLGVAHGLVRWVLAMWGWEKPGASTPEQHCEWSRQAIESAQELDPELAEVLIAEAWYRYLCHLDYAGALYALEKAQERTPNAVEILEPKGNILRRMGRFEDAIDTFMRAVELSPRYGDIRNHLIGSFSWTRRYEEAHDQYERAVALRPDNAIYYSNGAAASRQAGNVARAREIIARAREMRALAPGLLTTEANLDMMDRDFSAAIEILSQPEVNPESVAILLFKANALELSGDAGAARTHYDSVRVLAETALKEEPGDARTHMRLAGAYARLGRGEEAVREAEAAVGLMPVSRDAITGLSLQVSLAEVYAAVGEADRAVDLLDRLLSMPSQVSVPLLELEPAWDSLRDHPRFQELLSRDGT